jgi:hypothetical protein
MEYFNDDDREHAPAFEDCWCSRLRTFSTYENGGMPMDAERTKAVLMHCWEVSDYTDMPEDSAYEDVVTAIAKYLEFNTRHTEPEFEADDLRYQIVEIGAIIAALCEGSSQIRELIPGAEARVALLEEAE